MTFDDRVHWWAGCPDSERDDVEWGYGHFLGGDPRLFRPDGELCEVEEVARWTADCTRWEMLDRCGIYSMPEESSSRWIPLGPSVAHVQLCGYGVGAMWRLILDSGPRGGSLAMAV